MSEYNEDGLMIMIILENDNKLICNRYYAVVRTYHIQFNYIMYYCEG